MTYAYWESWELVPRFNGVRIYYTYKCPQCKGSGQSPYHDVNDDIIHCECCNGEGYHDDK